MEKIPENRNRKPVQSVYMEQDVSAVIQAKKDAGMSLRQIAAEYGAPITHADIERILQGRFPVGREKRKTLHIPEVCITCHQKVKRVRHVPEWVLQATRNLAELEAKANAALNEKRVYTREGKELIYEAFPVPSIKLNECVCVRVCVEEFA